MVYSSMICHGSVSYRSDQVGDPIISSEQDFGDWSQNVFCNPGYFAVGFQFQLSEFQVSSILAITYTAATSFRIICDDGQIAIADKEGQAGD